MSKSIKFMLFIFGISAGSAITWIYTKKKYEQIAQEEINSVKEVFSKRANSDGLKKNESGKQEEKNALSDYIEKVNENGYTNYSGTELKTKANKHHENYEKDHHIITPEEFGELYEYEKISLLYFNDKVLTDEKLDVIDNDDTDEIIGVDSLTHFGEYEDDSVFVRNDVRKCDYEILLDHRNYKDVVRKKQQSMEA